MIQNISSDDLYEKIRSIIKEEVVRSDKTEPDKKDYLTRKEAARFLRISLTTLYNFTKQGRIKGYRNGGKVLYNKGDLVKYLETFQTPSGKQFK